MSKQPEAALIAEIIVNIDGMSARRLRLVAFFSRLLAFRISKKG